MEGSRARVSIYASSTVMGLSGMFVMVVDATGWLYRGFPDMRRDCSPGKTKESALMNDHELTLLYDRSTNSRLEENRKGSSAAPGRLTFSMQFPRNERRSSLGRAVSSRTDDNESILLCSNINVVMVFEIGVETSLI